MKLICPIWLFRRRGDIVNILTKESITTTEFWNNVGKYQQVIYYEPNNLKQILNED